MVRSSKLVTCVSTHSQSCPTLCDSMDYSSPGSSIHGIFQAKILEWVDISFSNGSSRPRGQTHATWEAPLSYLHYNNYLTTAMMKMAGSFLRWQEHTHSSVLAWRIPGTGEPGGLLSVGSHGVGHDWSNLAAASTVLTKVIWVSSFLLYQLW